METSKGHQQFDQMSQNAFTRQNNEPHKDESMEQQEIKASISFQSQGNNLSFNFSHEEPPFPGDYSNILGSNAGIAQQNIYQPSSINQGRNNIQGYQENQSSSNFQPQNCNQVYSEQHEEEKQQNVHDIIENQCLVLKHEEGVDIVPQIDKDQRTLTFSQDEFITQLGLEEKIRQYTDDYNLPPCSFEISDGKIIYQVILEETLNIEENIQIVKSISTMYSETLVFDENLVTKERIKEIYLSCCTDKQFKVKIRELEEGKITLTSLKMFEFETYKIMRKIELRLKEQEEIFLNDHKTMETYLSTLFFQRNPDLIKAAIEKVTLDYELKFKVKKFKQIIVVTKRRFTKKIIQEYKKLRLTYVFKRYNCVGKFYPFEKKDESVSNLCQKYDIQICPKIQLCTLDSGDQIHKVKFTNQYRIVPLKEYEVCILGEIDKIERCAKELQLRDLIIPFYVSTNPQVVQNYRDNQKASWRSQTTNKTSPTKNSANRNALEENKSSFSNEFPDKQQFSQSQNINPPFDNSSLIQQVLPEATEEYFAYISTLEKVFGNLQDALRYTRCNGLEYRLIQLSQGYLFSGKESVVKVLKSVIDSCLAQDANGQLIEELKQESSLNHSLSNQQEVRQVRQEGFGSNLQGIGNFESLQSFQTVNSHSQASEYKGFIVENIVFDPTPQ